MPFEAWPAVAAFRYGPPGATWAREGFEVVFIAAQIDGHTTAVESGTAWATRYTIVVDGAFRSRRATVHSNDRTVTLVARDDGWLVDGVHAPHLDGCLDVDLEMSAFTNTLPIRRLELAIGAEAAAPAAYVRADLRVERLEQTYRRLADRRYRYLSPAFGVDIELLYDECGVVLDYPGLATRAL
jgi:hypothetical protein